MKAIRQHRFGGPAELRLTTVPDPHPDADQVRIRVQSAGVHLLDTVIRRGAGDPRVAPELPMVPGREVAGIVDEIGGDVDDELLGKPVVAALGLASGGYAELAAVGADAVHVLPDRVDADQAVAMVGTGRTTMAILELASPTAADVAMVTAAAGGIGTLLVQALRAAGATVIGLAGSQQKATLARDLGASIAIDYSRPGWTSGLRDALDGRTITLGLDGVGGAIGRSALELVGVGGRLVMFGSASGTPTELSVEDLYQRGITASTAVGARILQRPDGLRPLEVGALSAVADGWLQPVIGLRLPLAEAAAAHEAIEGRTTTGKTVLTP